MELDLGGVYASGLDREPGRVAHTRRALVADRVPGLRFDAPEREGEIRGDVDRLTVERIVVAKVAQPHLAAGLGACARGEYEPALDAPAETWLERDRRDRAARFPAHGLGEE